MKILVAKNEDIIAISFNGRKLIIDKNNKLFNELINLSKEEIKKFYEENHTMLKGGDK
jgi:hypothetical protein